MGRKPFQKTTHLLQIFRYGLTPIHPSSNHHLLHSPLYLNLFTLSSGYSSGPLLLLALPSLPWLFHPPFFQFFWNCSNFSLSSRFQALSSTGLVYSFHAFGVHSFPWYQFFSPVWFFHSCHSLCIHSFHRAQFSFSSFPTSFFEVFPFSFHFPHRLS